MNISNVHRIFDLAIDNAEKYPVSIAYSCKIRGSEKLYNHSEVLDCANKVSKFLISKNIQKGDHIGILSGNRPEHNIIDIGISQIGAVYIPLYPTYNQNDILTVLNLSEIKILFVGNRSQKKMIEKIWDKLRFLESIVLFDTSEEEENAEESLKSILATQLLDTDKLAIENRRKTVKEDDVYAIFFTSGTSDNPNGVIHTHLNFTNWLRALNFHELLKRGSKALSFLPICHVFERSLVYSYNLCGVEVVYAENMSTIMANIQSTSPDVFTCVPAFIEEFYNSILKNAEIGEEQRDFYQAIEFVKSFKFENRDSYFSSKQYLYFNKVFFAKWRNIFGSNIKCVFVGGAKLDEKYSNFFWAIGVKIYEFYGASELLCITYNSDMHHFRSGTIGKSLPNVEIEIEDDGEIKCRSNLCFKGYYNNEKLTALTLKDGWYYTGDLGYMDKDGFLRIHGRKRESFKTKSGKYVNPVEIENTLKLISYVANVIVFPNHKGDMNLIMSVTDKDIPMYKLKHDINDIYNSKVMKNDKIESFAIADEPWTIENGLLTPTRKIKRNSVLNLYSNREMEYIKLN
jgi:long-chain acyl-CoA synthetase